MKKLLGWIVVIIVFALFTSVIQFMAPTYSVMFPDFSDRALRNIESASNIIGLVLAVVAARFAYKSVTASKEHHSKNSEKDTSNEK